MAVRDKLKSGKAALLGEDINIADMSPQWRSQRAMADIDDILKKYGCTTQITHEIVIVPLRLDNPTVETPLQAPAVDKLDAD